MAARRVNLPRLTLLAGLAGFGLMLIYLVLYWDSNPPASLLTATGDPDRLDFYAEDAEGVRYGADGRWAQTFSAPRVTHYPLSARTLMTEPVLRFRAERDAIWDGNANNGELVGEDEIRLRGAVRVRNDAEGIELITEELDYFPERQWAQSRVRVNVRQRRDTTTATGMRADLGRNRIEFLRQVESRHVPL